MEEAFGVSGQGHGPQRATLGACDYGVGQSKVNLNIRGSGNTITLIFSEPMNPSSAANPDNYTVVQDGVGPLNIIGATLKVRTGRLMRRLAITLNFRLCSCVCRKCTVFHAARGHTRCASAVRTRPQSTG